MAAESLRVSGKANSPLEIALPLFRLKYNHVRINY
jgi:hypothetical protein